MSTIKTEPNYRNTMTSRNPNSAKYCRDGKDVLPERAHVQGENNMADEQTTTPEAAAAAEQGSPITVNAQYTKDLSFEVPSAPQVFSEMQKNQPDININIEVNARPLGEKTFEVELSIKASCTVGEMTGFILELLYAGVFTLNVPDEHRQAILLIECPRLLFPYARNILSDATRDGGFPPVMLGQVDFVAMYQNQLKTAQANADANGGNATA